MTLVQRRPREVYRVFDEDEFLVRSDDERRAMPPTPVAAERRLRRIAGATVLVAAAGAVCGLLVAPAVFPVSGTRRRTAVRLFAATVLPSSSSRLVKVAGRQLTVSRGSRGAGLRERSKRVDVSRRSRPALRSIGQRRAVSGATGGPTRALAFVTARRSTSVETAPSAGHTPPPVAGPPLQHSDRPEFGFER